MGKCDFVGAHKKSTVFLKDFHEIRKGSAAFCTNLQEFRPNRRKHLTDLGRTSRTRIKRLMRRFSGNS
jgi:hypothetical protein